MNLLGALRPTAVPLDPLGMATTAIPARIGEQAAIKAIQAQTDMTRALFRALDPNVGTRVDHRG
ncbi:MAG: hypothetical protein ACRDG3_04380 [Tepidiformaceae bacterium]